MQSCQGIFALGYPVLQGSFALRTGARTGLFLLLWDGANTEAELGNPPAPFHLVKLTFDKSITR